MSDGEASAASEPEPAGLDPDAAIRSRRFARTSLRRDAGPEPEFDALEPARLEPIIDTGRYQRMIGAFGLALVIAFSIYLFVHGGSGTPGLGPGQHLHTFVAPLATSDIDATANAHPVCDPARRARRGLNVCDRRPIVLAFFALGAQPCIRQIDTLQQVSSRFPQVQFAAVAVDAGRAATEKAVRAQHWTIPIAYDQSGIIGQIYGVEVCPLVEIARRGGRIDQRLIGKGWLSLQHLSEAVEKLEG